MHKNSRESESIVQHDLKIIYYKPLLKLQSLKTAEINETSATVNITGGHP
jgi:hypothetical protein